MANPAIQPLVSELQTLFKTVYGPAVVQQQNLEPMAYKHFKRSTKTFGGNHFEFPARVAQPWSLGMRGYGVALPTPQTSREVTAQVRQRYFYATGDVKGPDLAKGKQGPWAFINTYADKLAQITAAALKDMNFQFFLDGSGIYARIVDGTLAATDTTFTVDTVKYLRVGRLVDWWDDSAGALLTGSAPASLQITGLSVPAGVPTVTVAAPGAPAAAANGDALIPQTALATGSTAPGIFFHGLGAIVDDGTNVGVFQNIDRAAEPLWRATVLANGGTPRALTLTLMQQAEDVPAMISGKRPTAIWMAHNCYNKYLQLLVAQKRFVNTGQLDGGHDGLDFNGKRLQVDVDCQNDTIYFLHEPDIEHFGLMDLEFDDHDGAVLKHAGLASGDAFYFFQKAYANFGTDQCNSHSKIVDIEVDAAYNIAA